MDVNVHTVLIVAVTNGVPGLLPVPLPDFGPGVSLGQFE